MTLYRKKPVVVEARRYLGGYPQDAAPILKWIRENGGEATFDPFEHKIEIATLEGIMQASLGDYIIKGIQGEFYPCKPDIFEATYEEVEE